MTFISFINPLEIVRSLSSFSFGFGAAVGIGYIVRKVKGERLKRQEHLLSCLRQLSTEVRQLRETLLNRVVKVNKQQQQQADDEEAVDVSSSDDEFFDTERGVEPSSSITVEDESVFLERIDRLQNGTSAEQQDAYNMLITRTNQDGENKELLWRFAKAQHQISCLKEKAGDLEGQKFMLTKGLQTGSAAIEADRNNHEAYKWYAIILGCNIQFMSFQDKIVYGYKYKENIEKALALNPSDSTSHYLMGRYCFEIFMLPWYERTAASAIFGETLATVDDALKHFITAEELQPGFLLENMLYIAKCHYHKWDYAKAKIWLRKVIKSPSKEEDAERVKTEGLQMIKTCS